MPFSPAWAATMFSTYPTRPVRSSTDISWAGRSPICVRHYWTFAGLLDRPHGRSSDKSFKFRVCPVRNIIGDPMPSCWRPPLRSEEHTSELQSLMRISYADFCLKKKTKTYNGKLSLLHITYI